MTLFETLIENYYSNFRGNPWTENANCHFRNTNWLQMFSDCKYRIWAAHYKELFSLNYDILQLQT